MQGRFRITENHVKLFLETASLREAQDVAGWGVLSGVTTTPTLCAAEGVDVRQRALEIAQVVAGPVAVSIQGERRVDLVENAKEIAALAENVVVQLPVGVEGLAACRVLAESGISVALTLVFSGAQALLCAAAGAAYCCPYLGRLDDVGADGMALLEDIVQIYAVQGFATEVVASSLRNPAHVVGAARAGCDAAAVPHEVLRQMASHPLTDLGAARFGEDLARIGLGGPGYDRGAFAPPPAMAPTTTVQPPGVSVQPTLVPAPPPAGAPAPGYPGPVPAPRPVMPGPMPAPPVTGQASDLPHRPDGRNRPSGN